MLFIPVGPFSGTAVPTPSAPTVAYSAYSSTTNTGTQWTFSGVSVGTGDNVIVAVYIGSSAMDEDGVTVTIGADALHGPDLTDLASIGMFLMAHPGTTTADIVVDTGVSKTNCAIGVWVVSGGAVIQNTDFDAFHRGSSAGAVGVPENGFAIGFATKTTGSALSFTGVTERFESTVGAVSFHGGDYTATTAETLNVDTDATAALYATFLGA